MKKFLVSYFFFCFFFFSFFASGFVDSQDGFQYLAIARRMYYDHTFEMPEETFKTGENIHMSLVHNQTTGQAYSPTGLGYSLSLLPAVALEDVFLRLAGTEPLSAFPLENDWPVLLFASMTNAFWGALFTITIYSYLRLIPLQHSESLLLSFLFSIGTNIFVHTKHTFAHMIFVALMTLSFYFLKKYSLKKKTNNMIFSGLAMGGVVLSYNPTFAFVLPAYAVYYLLLTNWNFSKKYILKLIKDVAVFSIGFIPLLTTYILFNRLRLGGSGVTSYGANALELVSKFPPPYVIIEGFWGLLLSPGKSIFIYSPILIILLIFWFKLKKRILPELVAALIMFFVYLWNIGTLLGGPDYLVWHGDSSWGPRYMLPILPLFFIVIGYLFTQLTKNQKKFVVLPLFLFGFYINFLSVALPYQIRFAGLDVDAFFNGRNFNVYQYGNEIARYMPAFKMTKTLYKRVRALKQTFNHGEYNVRFVDGYDYPFDLGWAVWRGMQPLSVITFENIAEKPIEKLSFQIRNHQMDPTSSASAHLVFRLNEQEIITDTIAVDSEKEIILPFDAINEARNELKISTEFLGTSSASVKGKQAVFLQIFRINDAPQNLLTLDFPYVSPVSAGLSDVEYHFWGNIEKDPWSIWHMHSGVYEQTFDFWWIRPLHYWDLPKDFFLLLFVINIGGIVYFGWNVSKSIRTNEKNVNR